MHPTLARTYTALRQIARRSVATIPVVDRVVGNRLRQLERHLPLTSVLQSIDTGGEVRCDGYTLSYPADDLGTVSSLLLHGEYEPEVTEILRRTLVPGSTFVDLGANIGFFTVMAAKLVGPKGRVFAFEPLPHIAGYVEGNVERNGLGGIATVARNAVSDRSHPVTFSFDPAESVAAHIVGGAPDSPNSVTLTVEAVSLDDFFAARGWPTVTLVKMDVEGAELAAMRGMRELSARNPGMRLVFELLYETFGRDQARLQELLDTLATLGFNRLTVLHRDGATLQLPRDREQVAALSRRVNLNVLAEKV